LNRFTAKLVQGSARLAFWRKPAAAQPETPPAEAFAHSSPPEASPEAAADAPEPQPGRLARLKQALHWRRTPAQKQPPEPDQAVVSEPRSREHADTNATVTDEVPTAQLSLLARLKTRLRRQPGLPPPEANAAADAEQPPDQIGAIAPPSRERDDASATTTDELPAPKPSFLARIKNRFRRQSGLPPSAEDTDEPTPGDAEFADDENPVQVGLIRRVLAVLSNKWVWIPGVSVVLLALMGAMLLTLLQSVQETKQLQAELLSTQKKLEQATTKKTAASRAASRQAGNHAVATAADSRPGIDAGDCTVTDKESVIQNLRNCIDSFNSLPDHPAPPPIDAAGVF
jgi:hypothetical protein